MEIQINAGKNQVIHCIKILYKNALFIAFQSFEQTFNCPLESISFVRLRPMWALLYFLLFLMPDDLNVKGRALEVDG
jgi:hypothetical protein